MVIIWFYVVQNKTKQKQSVVAETSTEYLMLANGAAELVWIQALDY